MSSDSESAKETEVIVSENPFDDEGKAKKPKGGRGYDQIVIDKAFDLYCKGHSYRDIDSKIGVSIVTLCKWSQYFWWEEKRERMFTTIEEAYQKERTDTLLEERRTADDRHRKIVRSMQLRIAKEYEHEPRNGKEDARRLSRMKCHKIAAEAFSLMIDHERRILGINDEAISKAMPKKYVFQIESKSDPYIPLEAEDVRKMLVNQDPHHYNTTANTSSRQADTAQESQGVPVIGLQNSSQRLPQPVINPVTINESATSGTPSLSRDMTISDGFSPTNPFSFLNQQSGQWKAY